MSEKPKILRTISLFLCALPLAAILYYRPYFGLMDDWSNFYSVLPKIHSQGLLSASWDYARQDILWGMFRPVYPVMIWILYQPASLFGASALFALNWVVVLLSLYLLNKALGKLSGIAVSYLFLGDFAWFHFHDIFQHPSLQEKLLFLFGGALLLQCIAFGRDQRVYRSFFIFLFLALGMLSKASFCIYAAMGFVILCGIQKRSTFSNAVVAIYALLTAVGTLALRHIAKLGTYTQGNFSLDKVLMNAKTATGIFLLLLATVAVFSLYRDFKRNKFSPDNFCFLSLIVGLFAFLAIFLPWGIGGYLDTDIAAIATALALSFCSKVFSKSYQKLLISGISGLAILITSYKSVTMNLRLSDVRVAVESVSLLKANNVSQIYMPCVEGADAMRTYWQHKGWAGEVVRADFFDNKPKTGQVVFYDQGFCTLPNRSSAVDGCEQEDLLPVRWGRSFHLVRLKNCKS